MTLPLCPRQIMKSFTPCASKIFMMCHRMGLPPISTIGFGRTAVSSLMRVPYPPARMTAFMVLLSIMIPLYFYCLKEHLSLQRPSELLGPCNRPLGELFAKKLVVNDGDDAPRKALRIAVRNQISGFHVTHGIAESRHIGGDDRRTASIRFYRRDAPSLHERWVPHHPRVLEQLDLLFFGHTPREMGPVLNAE